ncbi:MAG TPA: 5'/3'-nucleotidase SurE [Nitrospiria bacterium]|nr:5'/3'-nucleotidase SurE [Nitrospiria bacterium]
MATNNPKILVTNDDGVHSPGLHKLAAALKSLGDVVVVAPDRERSAASHALTLHKPLRVDEVKRRVYCINGTPSDCVNLGVMRLTGGRPALIASGVNQGENLGDDVTYSGTVSAAIEGTLLGIPSMAISLVGGGKKGLDAACRIAAKLAGLILEYGLPHDTLLNVNVPDLPAAKVKGAKITTLGRRVFDEDSIVEKTDPRGKNYYWIGGNRDAWKQRSDTDHQAVEQGLISITPLHLDLTNYQVLNELKGWEGLLK